MTRGYRRWSWMKTKSYVAHRYEVRLAYPRGAYEPYADYNARIEPLIKLAMRNEENMVQTIDTRWSDDNDLYRQSPYHPLTKRLQAAKDKYSR
jgi:hypothetical protein